MLYRSHEMVMYYAEAVSLSGAYDVKQTAPQG